MDNIKRIRSRAFTIAQNMFIALCCIITFSNAAESVREMMAEEVTTLPSLYDFYSKHTSPYERRYFMQYAPEYLAKFGVSDAPLWLSLALDSALGSNYVPLTISAVNCIGDMKIESFSGKLVNEFNNSGKKPDLSLAFRIAVLESFKKFPPSLTMEENIGLLLKNFRLDRIFDPDFTALMEATMLFGSKEYISYIDNFEAKVNSITSLNVQAPEKQYELNRVKQLIKRTKNSISVKEVGK